MPVLSKGQPITIGPIDLLVQDELGSGAFGTVYKVYDSTKRKTYALKEVICENQRSVNTARREIKTLAKANHERIVRILGYDFDELCNGTSQFLILTEFCSGGDLNSRLNKSSSRETNLKWIFQISEALCYLHSLNPPIVHRDLKADNVLLTDQYTEDLKLADFGLAREYLAMKNADSNSESAQMYYMISDIGPRHWMAPEFFHRHYTEKADVFSLGGIFYAILTRDFVQFGAKKMYGVFLTYSAPTAVKVGLGYAMAKIDSNAEVLFPSSFQGSNSMMRLIQNMLNCEPHNRPSACQVKDSVENMRSSMKVSQPNQASTGCTGCY